MKAIAGALTVYIFTAAVLAFLAYSICRYFDVLTSAGGIVSAIFVVIPATIAAVKTYIRLETY